MIKLLIVDDSALMRRQLISLFEFERDFEIKIARNGKEAVELNLEFQPDVITLDINMPEMDGLTALSLLMEQRPVSVVMVSSLTEKGALVTFEALALGAVDYILKPGGTISLSIDAIKTEVISKVRAAARARVKTARGLSSRLRAERTQQPESRFVRRGIANNGLVIVGVSTGGPRTLEDILPQLPMDFPWPILVAQHMPPSFTAAFANRMNDICALQVLEASHPMPIEPGKIYVGKGGADMVVVKRAGKLTVVSKPEAKEFLWHPSVELLGRSVIENCDLANVIAVMLTGMGYDGAEAFSDIKRKGGRTIAESEASSVVFGMPAELIKRSGASVVLDANKVANQLIAWAK